MIKSYFWRQYQEMNAYYAAFRRLLDSLPEEVRDDLMAHTALGRIPRDLEEVEHLLERRYPPFPGTRLLDGNDGERGRGHQAAHSMASDKPLLRVAGFGPGATR